MKIINVLKVLITGLVLLIVGSNLCYSQPNSNVTIYESSLNHEINPIGIDDVQPDFSWKIQSATRRKYQKAYQIVVWSGNKTDTCWNSGKVISDNNIQVKSAGKPLKMVSAYNWKVRIWDNDGKASSWSKENHFSMGLLSENDWKADWISTPDAVYSPVFVKKFRVDKVPDVANAFVN